MAAYAMTRQRTLRGMGTTYSFVPRRRTLRGMGAAIAPPDIGMPVFPGVIPFVDPQPAPPPFVFTDVRPIIPAPVITPVTPPNLGPSIPGGGVQFVLPSQGPVPPPPQYAAAAGGASWLDQKMIAGIPNSYLALATVGLVLFVSMAGAKRRR